MNSTRIEWVNGGATWNPITGCWGPGGSTEKPARCPYCFAMRIARRFGKTPAEKRFEPIFRRGRLGEPKKKRKATAIFVCSMSDLLGEWVPKEWIELVIGTMRETPQHPYITLTQNPARYAEFEWPPTVVRGATARTYDEAVVASDCLEKVGGTTFLSIEPVSNAWSDLSSYGFDHARRYPAWIIVGAQTGSGAPPVSGSAVTVAARWASEMGAKVFVKENAQVRATRFPQEYPKQMVEFFRVRDGA